MKKDFVTGLIILLPLTITILIISFLVNFLTKPFVGIVTAIFHYFHIHKLNIPIISSDEFILYASKILILVFLFAFTTLLGYIGERIFFKSLARMSDNVLHKIPIVNKVYKTSKEIINTLFVSDKNSFQQVVLVPFPHEGIYAIGLISREAPEECKKGLNNESMLSVFVPTTPNPTAGFMVMCKKEDLVFLNMTTEEAVKYIVSCGVIIPEDKSKVKPS